MTDEEKKMIAVMQIVYDKFGVACGIPVAIEIVNAVEGACDEKLDK